MNPNVFMQPPAGECNELRKFPEIISAGKKMQTEIRNMLSEVC